MDFYIELIMNNLFEKIEKISDEDVYYENVKEYALIDYTFWRTRKGVVDSKLLQSLGLNTTKKNLSKSESVLNSNTWEIITAIEHENNIRDWVYEVKQLMLIRTPLRVVISYTDKEINKEDIELLFKTLDTHYTDSLLPNDEYLLILGNTVNKFDVAKVNAKSAHEAIGYKYYLFENGEVTQL